MASVLAFQAVLLCFGRVALLQLRLMADIV